MTKKIYNKSIETCEVQLVGFWPHLAHFGFVGFLFFIPTMMLSFHLIDYLQGNPESFKEGEAWFIIIPTILSVIAYWIQKRRLKFRVIKTKLNRVQLKEVLIAVAEKLKWNLPRLLTTLL